jgi:hypothetical protein
MKRRYRGRLRAIFGLRPLRRHVAVGSIASVRPSARHFRSAPINGHQQTCPVGPVRVESRCDAVALGSNISVSAPFVRRCLTGSTMSPFSHPAHRTGQADFPHPALGQDFTLARATPSAASEHFSELIGFPISRSFTTYCVCLELRSLPSTGITRLQRYYEPLRHPRAPSLSLTGFRLVTSDHALGLPVLRTLSLCTCCRQYPGVADGRNLRSTRPAISTFPDMAVGSAYTSSFSRLAQRSLALRPAHSRCHQFVTR